MHVQHGKYLDDKRVFRSMIHRIIYPIGIAKGKNRGKSAFQELFSEMIQSSYAMVALKRQAQTQCHFKLSIG